MINLDTMFQLAVSYHQYKHWGRPRHVTGWQTYFLETFPHRRTYEMMGCDEAAFTGLSMWGLGCRRAVQELLLSITLILSKLLPPVNCDTSHHLEFWSQTSPLLAESSTSLFFLNKSLSLLNKETAIYTKCIYAKKHTQSTVYRICISTKSKD